MKITNFSFSVEVSKDKDGYSNHYYVCVGENGVNVSHPYCTQTAEEVMFVANLVKDFIAQSIEFNARVDGFNRDMHLEQYAPLVATTSSETVEETEESAVPQSSDSPVGTTQTESIEAEAVETESTEVVEDINKQPW